MNIEGVLKEKAKAAVLASFAADSLALAAHWIYDTSQLDERFGRIERLTAPGKDSFHATKTAGDFTHYGDQMLVLLESLAQRAAFDLDDFARRWRAFFDGYTGYIDKATSATLENMARGAGPEAAGSLSTDLAGAGRIAPLVHLHRNDRQALVRAARLQTAMTHNEPTVVAAAGFFAEMTWEVLHGADPREALQAVVRQETYRRLFTKPVDAGLASAAEETRAAVSRFGQSCATEGAFPSVVHLIARYTETEREALIQNVMAGGDSAGRGLLAGLVLGAHGGRAAVPDEWISEMRATPRILQLLDGIDRAG